MVAVTDTTLKLIPIELSGIMASGWHIDHQRIENAYNLKGVSLDSPLIKTFCILSIVTCSF